MPTAYAQEKTPIFFSTLHDIPLMEGLKEIETDTTSYDKPGGRIIDAYAITHKHSPEKITAFYNATLPQFGWGQTEGGIFYREQEILKLTIKKHENQYRLKISVRPSL